MKFKQGQKIIVVNDSMSLVPPWVNFPTFGTILIPYPEHVDSDAVIIKTKTDSIWCQMDDIVPDNKFFRKLYGIK